MPPIMPTHPPGVFGPSPIPPPHLIQQYPHSRSMTPASTYRVRRGGGNGENGGDRGVRTSSLIQSSMQSTPEANKRDKV